MLLSSVGIEAQIQGRIVNSETMEPIPYVNIWVKGKSNGTNSDMSGYYHINAQINDTLIFSAVGYQTSEVSINQNEERVMLKPSIQVLDEVIVKPTKEFLKIINPIRAKKCGYSYGVGDKVEPWMIGRIFLYDSAYQSTPYIQKIRFVTRSDIRDALMNIRVYVLDQEALPDQHLVKKNLQVEVKKGRRINEVDISGHDLKFPGNGIAVVAEWYVLPRNRYEYQYTMSGSRKKRNGVSYEPSICTMESEDQGSTLIYRKGKWRKAPPFPDGSFRAFSVEITLSN